MSQGVDVLDQLSEAVFVVVENRITTANVAAATLLGAPKESISGVALEQVLAPGEVDRLERLESQRSAGWPVPDTFRARFVRLSDHGEVLTDLRVKVSSSKPRTVVLSARDVTEVTRAEQLVARLAELSASSAMLGPEELLRTVEPVFAALGWQAAFVEVTPVGALTQKVLNPGPPGDPVGDYGRSLLGVNLPLDRAPLFAEVIRTGKALFLDNVPTLFDGPVQKAVKLSETMERARLTRTAWAPIRVEGQITHVLAVFSRDLTEHDFVAIQLFAAQIGASIRVSELKKELVRQERLAAVGEMAAVLAHEVRNPLGVIFNAVGALRKSMPVANDDTAGLLDILSEDAKRLQRLVNDMLDFSRPVKPHPEYASVAPLVKQALSDATADPSCTTREANLQVEVPESLPKVWADPALLNRVLLNVLLNACQHVPEHGRIRITAEEVNSAIRLSIFNEGRSIDPGVATRIFQPFFTTRSTGTGLGLAVVRRIMEGLHGRVELDPTANGVQFSIWIPTAPPVVRAA